MWKALHNLIWFWIKVRAKYEGLNSNPEKKEKSISLGVNSLIMSIVGAAFTVGLAVLAYYCLLGMQTLAFIFALMFGVALAIAAILCYVELVLASIVYARYQIKLNKKAIGYVALAVSLLLSVGTIFITLLVFSKIAG